MPERSFLVKDRYGLVHRVDSDFHVFQTFKQCWMMYDVRRNANGTSYVSRTIVDYNASQTWDVENNVITCLECADRPYSPCGYDFPFDQRAVKRR